MRTPSLQKLLVEADWVQRLAAALVADTATRDDLTQDTWVAALEHDRRVQDPRAWLRTVLQNLARQRARAARRRAAREQRAARPEAVEGPGTVLERAELHRRLVDRVLALPEPGRTLVLERFFEGIAPRALARRHGLPVETVRTRLKSALALLRDAMARDERTGRGGFRALAVPLVTARSTSMAMAAGIWIMTTTKYLVAIGAVVLLGLGGWLLRGWPAGQPTSLGGSQRFDSSAVRAADAALPARAIVASTATELPLELAAVATGSLLVRVKYDDGAPAPDVVVSVRRRNGELRAGVRRARTDASGCAHIAGLAPERVRIGTDRAGRTEELAIGAGTETETTLVIPVWLEVAGIVVDPHGTPVAGAAVTLAPTGMRHHDTQQVATSGTDGRFRLRSGFPNAAYVGARARGYAPSRQVFVGGLQGAALEVRLELPGAGGEVEGTVVDARGRPVADAVVRVGAGRLDTVIGGPDGAAPTPVQVWTDTAGIFAVAGVAPGAQPITVRAAGLAPWRGACVVVASASVRMAITLAEGATVSGFVTDEEGAPIADVLISVGESGDLAESRARSGADGSYSLTGLTAGEVTLHARHALLGEAWQTLVALAGQTARWDFRLVRGVVITGQIVRGDGHPVSGAHVALAINRDGAPGWSAAATSGSDGRFAVANWPGGRVDLEVHGHGIEPLQQRGLDPAGRELQLRVRALEGPSTRIIGRACAPDGTPLPSAIVSVRKEDSRQPSGVTFTAPGTAHFELTWLQPGTYCLEIDAEGHAPWRSKPIALAPGGDVDLGTVHLQLGGVVRVELDGERPAGFSLLVCDVAAVPVVDIATDVRPWRSRGLAPGSYRLRVRSEDQAVTELPFAVRAGETTTITIPRGR